MPDLDGDLDLTWFRTHLLEEILPRWLRSACTETGLFLPRLDRQWIRIEGDFGTLVSQSRLLYNFSAGYRFTGERAYLEAVERGARFLTDRFVDRESGGCFWSCGMDGEARDRTKIAYGHAFAIFGLAHAFGATGDTLFRDAAFQVWEVVKSRFFDVHGGLIPSLTRELQDAGGTRTQNPIMHLFEALLALGELAESPAVLHEAGRIADFVLTKLVRPADGALPEVYTPDWMPLPGDRKGRIDIGHQFEWAFLLTRAVDLGLPEGFLAAADRLLDYGLAHGYDAQNGGVFSPAALDGTVLSDRKSWWEQCEAMRTLLHFASFRGRTDLAGKAAQTLRFIQAHFVDPEFGGWYMVVESDGTVPNTDKGTEWKLDYHVTGMCLEALRCEEVRIPSPVEPE